MTTIHQASFEAGLQTAVDLANATATRLAARTDEPNPTAAVEALKSYAVGIQALLEGREPDPVEYTVRAIGKGC